MSFHSLGSALGLAIVMAAGLGTPVMQAQGPVPVQAGRPDVPPTPAVPSRPAATPASLTPIRLVVEIQRYEGEKRISNHPYTLWVTANDSQGTRLNAGQEIPIPTSVITPGTGNPPTRSVNYQSVGTNIQASATQADDGRYRVTLNVQDSSVIPSKDTDGFVTLRSLQTTNLLLLTDGQRADFLAATDKVSGEVTRISVTMTVLK
jgi:hypothetical protein